MKVAIAILHYNGWDLLQNCLPSVLIASKKSRFLPDVFVLDNGSTDESVPNIQHIYPEVRLWQAKENRVLCSYNDLLPELSHDIVVLLNNDISVEEDFLDPLIEIFERHPNAFFAAPKVLHPETRRYEGNLTRMQVRFGIFESTCFFKGHETLVDKPGYTLQTGYGAFHRERFLNLGGYDDLYLPGRVEDADLCFRAWRRGYKGYYVPRSVVTHEGAVTFRKVFGQKRMETITYRNIFLFMWKNIADRSLLLEHFFFLAPRLLFALFRRNFPFIRGFFSALPLLPNALKKRKKEQKITPAFSDKEIFRIA